jgi:predicted DNA-binding ribbon-helix-helix protein
VSGSSAMIRKTVRIGTLRTSILLEPEFWIALRSLAGEGPGRLPALVAGVAAGVPPGGNLASALRVHALLHAPGPTIVQPPAKAVTWVPPGVVPGRRQSQATVNAINAARRREART